jgi:hypothetical protein
MSTQDLGDRVDDISAASRSGFSSIDGALHDVANALEESRKREEDAAARLQNLDTKLDETGQRVERSKKPGEEAVALLRQMAEVNFAD